MFYVNFQNGQKYVEYMFDINNIYITLMSVYFWLI